ncbi:MAG: hypothetical protein ACK6BG_13740 [Cyanobacteriota bacterium]|jgi:hypothetical protein
MPSWRQCLAPLQGPGAWRALPSLLLLVAGWLLSPLCWWNDLLINLPLALGFARLVSLLNPAWMLPALVSGYWLTNMVGILLMQNGALAFLPEERRPQRSRELLWGVVSSSVVTLGVVGAVQLGWLSVPPLDALPLETVLPHNLTA